MLKNTRLWLELGKEFVHLTGEFEKQVKKLCLDPKAEKELIDICLLYTSDAADE